MEDVRKIHAACCPKAETEVIKMSMDGVQESKSSSVSNDVFSISFHGCNKVYPIRLIRPINRFKYDVQSHIKAVIDEINEQNFKLSKLILDNPKRADFKCCMTSAATFGCEYCEAGAILVRDSYSKAELTTITKKYECKRKHILNTIEFLRESPGTAAAKAKDMEKIDNFTKMLDDLVEEEKKEKKKSNKRQLAWPSSTFNGLIRTTDLIKYTVNNIETSEIELTKQEKKGIKGKSHLLYQPNFHFINDIPTEYMHLGCLGVVKRLIELTFNVGEKRDRLTKRKLTEAIAYNLEIMKIQAVREFNRRSRNLDLGIMKAQEHRNVILFYFPIVVNCIEPEFPSERKIWLLLAFLFRSCILPNNEFENIPTELIKNASKQFYELYEKAFGTKNCTYSIHVFSSHILRIRGNEPLTCNSAFLYESFYSEMRNMFHAGTVAPTKQVLQNTYMKRILETHTCERPILYDVKKKEKGLENNSLIYVVNANLSHDFYVIQKVIDDNKFLCKKQGRFLVNFPEVSDIPWEKIGVYKTGPLGDEEIVIEKENVAGKALKVQKYFITCPINVLHEK